MGYHPCSIGFLTCSRDPAGGQCQVGSLTGAVASETVSYTHLCEERNVEFYYPSPIFCTDNAAMIGVAAYYEYLNGTRHGWDLNAVPNLKLGER